MKIELNSLILLYDVFNAVPYATPKRIQIITAFIKELEENNNGNLVLIDLDDGFSDDPYTVSEDTMSKMAGYVNKKKITDHMPSKDIERVLLPSRYFCCKKFIRIDGRYHASITLYTEDGVKRARTYHANCAVCGKVYYHGYNHDKGKNIRKYELDGMEYFIATTKMGFSVKLLQNITNQIFIGSVSFQSSAEIYSMNNGLPREMWMNPDRLEESWYLYQIAKYCKEIIWHRNSNKECNVEQICHWAYQSIACQIDEKWKNHICDEVGCQNRLVVIDGNEKMFRLICGAEKIKDVATQGQPMQYSNICIRDPIRGNQHVAADKCCAEHKLNKSADIPEPIDFKRVTRSMKMIPPTISNSEGCKKDKDIDRFHERTAGMLYVFRSCGIRLSHYEMYTAESLSNAFLCLLDLFQHDMENLLGIVYDRACSLHPFIKRLADEGHEAAKKFSDLWYIVDIFHAEKHTTPKCVLGDPACEYHPRLSKFSKVNAMNTEIAEQSFRVINPFKYMTRRMTYSRRLVFLKLLDNFSNERLVMSKSQKCATGR